MWVNELAGDSAFNRWLGDNGLTLAEAARIQVVYARPVSNAQVAGVVTFGLAAPIAMGTAFGTTLWNLGSNSDGHSAKGAWAGFVAGSVAMVAGSYLLGNEDMRSKLGKPAAASIGIGALSLGIATRTLFRHDATLAAQREAAAKHAVADASISPIVTPDGKAGVGVTLRF